MLVRIHNADLSELELRVWTAWQDAGQAACRETGEPLDLRDDGLPLLWSLLYVDYPDLSRDEADRIALKLITRMDDALNLIEAEPMGGVH